MPVRVIPKGTPFIRWTWANMLGRSASEKVQIAERWHDTPEVAYCMRSAQEAGSTADPAWAGALVDYAAMSGEFIDTYRPGTILGKLATTRVPFATKTPRLSDAGVASWVGQNRPAPISELAFDTITLGNAKQSMTVVFSDELLRLWSPGSEAFVRAALTRNLTTFSDQQCIDPSIAAVLDVSPASITNGISPTHSTGATFANALADLKAQVQKFIDAGNAMPTSSWVMNPRTALSLSTMYDTAGARGFPDISPLGGKLLGLPVIVSAAVPIVTTTTCIVLVDGSRILVADDGLATVDASRQASLQMNSAPTTGTAAGVSLWQLGLSAARVTRWINYARADAAAVAVLDQISY